MEQRLQAVLTCAFCLETYSEPQILPCGHSLCKKCVNQISRSLKVDCPLCRTVADVSLVRPDFRTQQILDAMNTTTYPSAPPLSAETGATDKCIVCSQSAIAYWCEECRHWYCNGCKKEHKNTDITRAHHMTSLSDRKSSFKSKLQTEQKNMDREAKNHEAALKKWKQAVNVARTVNLVSIKSCADFRAECHRELDRHFDNLQLGITNFISSTVTQFQGEIRTIETQLREINRQKDDLTQVLNNKTNKVALDGEILLRNAHAYTSSIKPPNLDIKPPIVNVSRNYKWSDVDAARATMQRGTLPEVSLLRVKIVHCYDESLFVIFCKVFTKESLL